MSRRGKLSAVGWLIWIGLGFGGACTATSKPSTPQPGQEAAGGEQAASKPATAPGVAQQGGGETMTDAQAGYLLLSDGSIHTGGSKPEAGFYLVGTVKEGRFSPEGDIQGEGMMGQGGQPGWMELADGVFHGDQTARPPFPPYVRGFRAPDGEFRPSGRTVEY